MEIIASNTGQEELAHPITIPLSHFWANLWRDRPSIKLGNMLELQSFTQRDREQLWAEWKDAAEQAPGFYGYLHPSGYSGASLKLTGTYMRRSYDDLRPYEFAEEALRVITALRLLHAGDIGTLGLFCHYAGASLSELKNSYDTLEESRSLLCFNSYHLEDADMESFNSVYAALARLNESGLVIALRRFNQAYDRRIYADRLIDLTISLESSLLQDSNTELSYRSSIRGAVLLAGIRPVKQTRQDLQKLYKARSEVVHGVSSKKSVEIDVAFVEHCTDLVRDVLRAFVLECGAGKTIEGVINDLDNSIVSGHRIGKEKEDTDQQGAFPTTDTL